MFYSTGPGALLPPSGKNTHFNSKQETDKIQLKGKRALISFLVFFQLID